MMSRQTDRLMERQTAVWTVILTQRQDIQMTDETAIHKFNDRQTDRQTD
jgi:hypothetical protein